MMVPLVEHTGEATVGNSAPEPETLSPNGPDNTASIAASETPTSNQLAKHPADHAPPFQMPAARDEADWQCWQLSAWGQYYIWLADWNLRLHDVCN